MRWICMAVLAAGLTFAASLGRGDEVVEPAIGKQIDHFSLPDFHGQIHALDDYADKPVVLAFLGTECPLARKYAPRLRSLADEYEKRGVVFLAVFSNLQDTLTEIAAFARSFGIPFPVLKDNNNELADRVGATRTPEVVLLDRRHVVRYCGRIDDQYGFKTANGYVKPRINDRSLANAIDAVLAGKKVANSYIKAAGCLIGRVVKQQPRGDITYSQQISRIFQDRCVECHRAGEAAPFTMTSYDDVLGWAQTICEVIAEERMPPWFADPRYGHFSNDARLSEEEKQQIYAWVENGCPEGDPKDLPEPRKFIDGWQIGEPDQVIYMRDEPYAVPAEGVLPYQYFTVDPGWERGKWIQATEVRAGNRAVVHHVRVDVKPENVTDPFPRNFIGAFAPGFKTHVCPPGTALYVPAHSKLVFQLHYTPNGSPQEDRSLIGIRFADPASVTKLMQASVVDSRDFKIAAGDPHYEVRASRQLQADVMLLSLLPHMHLRGKSFKYEADYPDGTSEVLLSVPRYDFNWQLRYVLTEPKMLPRGTTLRCTAYFDNSNDNLSNPDSNKVVTFGPQVFDEMMEGLYTYVTRDQDDACIALSALSRTEE